MQTLATKLLGLLLLLAGLLLVAAVTDSTGTVSGMLQKLPDPTACPVMAKSIDWRMVGGVAGGACVLLGLVGLFSRIRHGAGKIAFRGDHGDVVIELAPIQHTLKRMIKRLPEVRRARVQLKPEKDGRRVQVRVEVMLQNCAEQGLRRTAALVSACIEEAVGKALGLEDLATVRLVVKGVHVDARSAARRLHDEVEARKERESASLEVAVARPPISSVTMGDIKTPDPESVAGAGLSIGSVTTEDLKPADPAPAAAVHPAIACGATEEPKTVGPDPVEAAVPSLSPITFEEPATAAPEPAAEAEPAEEELPSAVEAAPEETPEERTGREGGQV